MHTRNKGYQMKQHDFIPLVTFRGWKNGQKVIASSYAGEPMLKDRVIHCSLALFFVMVDNGEIDKDSLGIYTGANDRTKWEDRPKEYLHIQKEDWKGVPIFCSIAGAKYGSDLISSHNSKYFVDFHNGKFMLKRNVFWAAINTAAGVEVIGNQYEQHLKEQQ